MTVAQAASKERTAFMRGPSPANPTLSRFTVSQQNGLKTVNETMYPDHPELTIHQVSQKRRIVTMSEPVAEGSSTSSASAVMIAAHVTMRHSSRIRHQPMTQPQQSSKQLTGRGPYTCMDLHIQIPSCRDIAYLDRMLFVLSTRPFIRTNRSSPFTKFFTKRRFVTMSRTTTQASATTRTSAVAMKER